MMNVMMYATLVCLNITITVIRVILVIHVTLADLTDRLVLSHADNKKYTKSIKYWLSEFLKAFLFILNKDFAYFFNCISKKPI